MNRSERQQSHSVAHCRRCPTPTLRFSPRLYQRPRLILHGPLGELIRGASWKGVDSVGELDPEQAFPG